MRCVSKLEGIMIFWSRCRTSLTDSSITEYLTVANAECRCVTPHPARHVHNKGICARPRIQVGVATPSLVSVSFRADAAMALSSQWRIYWRAAVWLHILTGLPSAFRVYFSSTWPLSDGACKREEIPVSRMRIIP